MVAFGIALVLPLLPTTARKRAPTCLLFMLTLLQHAHHVWWNAWRRLAGLFAWRSLLLELFPNFPARV